MVDDSTPGWSHTGLRTATLTTGGSVDLQLGDHEAMVLPLDGGVIVDVGSPDGETESFTLAGRAGVFAGATDVVYAPPGTTLRLRPRADLSEGDAVRVAVCLAHAGGGIGIPARYLPAADVPVELRGAGIASRQVRNFGVPGVLDAHRIIACEVVTPAGNWSSWPPHKHDTDRPGVEAELEEIYWFETQPTDGRGTDAVGYQRVYGTEDRPIDVLAEVRTGDVVLVPHGWHGPAVAAPDADLYYLNVMAGPGAERAWLICDDPAHAWVRDTWPDLPVDPRLAPPTPDRTPTSSTHHAEPLDPKDTHMRIGLAGTGRIGAFHAKTLTTLDGVDDLVLADLDTALAERVATDLGVGAAPSIDALLDSGLDAFVITAGTAAHAELLEAAISRDIPTFCEKPVALDLERTIALTELEARSAVPVHIGFQRRFDTGYRRVRDAVASGELGFIHTVRAATMDQAPPHAAYLPTSGGLFRDCSVHDFDILRFVTGPGGEPGVRRRGQQG